MEYFTGSLCLGQFNIIEYCSRGFSTVDSMDTAIIENINKTVPRDNSKLFILGDFVFCPLTLRFALDKIKEYRKRINCRHVSLVLGNQDKRLEHEEGFRNNFYRVADIMEYITESQVSLILCHYPFRGSWNRIQSGSINLHAHCHGKELQDDFENQLDVSVDSAKVLLGEYRPFTVEEVVKFAKD